MAVNDQIKHVTGDDGKQAIYVAPYCNSRQMKAMEALSIAQSILDSKKDIIKERLYINGQQKEFGPYCCGVGLIHRVLKEVMMTVPQKQLRHIITTADNTEQRMVPINVGRDPETIVIRTEDVFALTDEVLKNGECSMCLKEGKEIKQCAIRQALSVVLPCDGLNNKISCCYAGARAE